MKPINEIILDYDLTETISVQEEDPISFSPLQHCPCHIGGTPSSAGNK